jgi:hypothetical protein
LEEHITSTFRVKETRSRVQGSLLLADFFLGLYSDPENGGNMFLENVRLFPNYTA